MPSARKSHKSIGKALRQLGVLPKGYKLNALTKNQKDRIRKLERKFDYETKHPSQYKPVKVRGATKAALKAAGFKAKRETVLVPTYGAKRVSVTGEKITRKFKAYRTETLTQKPGDIYKQAEEFFKHKKPGETLMLRVGKHQPQGMHIRSMADFNAYISILKSRLEKATTKKKAREVLHDLYIVKHSPALSEEDLEDYDDD